MKQWHVLVFIVVGLLLVFLSGGLFLHMPETAEFKQNNIELTLVYMDAKSICPEKDFTVYDDQVKEIMGVNTWELLTRTRLKNG